ncbi:hypothetical protein RA265_29980, partial [Pseudomonas syringae pv. tagetis]|uniref:hypothetical protein n=1 Tax=Pseudomonas syringae group genomosp. 7 TaxID=251699 RepID=UPI00376F99C7
LAAIAPRPAAAHPQTRQNRAPPPSRSAHPQPALLDQDLLNEKPGERDIDLYVAAPQQVLAQSPQQLLLDPADTLRLW